MLDHFLPPRYRTTYRQDEVDLVCRLALKGESLCFLGLSGVGKSNLVNYLHLTGGTRGQEPSPYPEICFPVVDARIWQCTPASLWGLMLTALSDVCRDAPELRDSQADSLAEDDRAFRRLQLLAGWACHQMKRPVMFILDDFDQVLANGPLGMLERLVTLRNDSNRDYLSYLVFTKRLPHVLGRPINLAGNSKFYGLWRSNIYPLRPYGLADALQMAEYLNIAEGKPLMRSELGPLCTLAGGHARLLKLVFKARVRSGPLSTDADRVLAASPALREECLCILRELHEQEQEVAVRAAHNRLRSDDLDTLDHLLRRGFMTNANPPAWFSPLMGAFLRTYEP